MEQEDWGWCHGNRVGSCPSHELSTEFGPALSVHQKPSTGRTLQGDSTGAQPLLPQAWSGVTSPRSGPRTRGTQRRTAVMCVAWVRVMCLRPHIQAVCSCNAACSGLLLS